MSKRPEVLVALPTRWDHPSFDAVTTFVQEVAAAGAGIVPANWMLGQLVKRLPFRLPQRRRVPIIVPLVNRQFALLAAAARHGVPVVWAWDVWEQDVEDWATTLNRFRVPAIMVTSRISERLLVESEYRGDVHYLADAVRAADFLTGEDANQRSIDVLELGRRHEEWHSKVVQQLEMAGLRHIYEPEPGRLAFDSRRSMISGLADSRISVCFPRSMTHPDSAGAVEALTQRYLESVASRCLILGHAPADMVELFGYDPVVEVDWSDPAGQVADLLAKIDSYQELIDRNYQRLLEVGDWSARTDAIVSVANSAAGRPKRHP